MKRLFMLTIVIIAVLSLCACSSNRNPATSNKDYVPETLSSAPQDDTTPAEDGAPVSSIVGEQIVCGDSAYIFLFTRAKHESAVAEYYLFSQLEEHGCDLGDFELTVVFNDDGTYFISEEAMFEAVHTRENIIKNLSSWLDEDTKNIYTFMDILGNDTSKYDETTITKAKEMLVAIFSNALELSNQKENGGATPEEYLGKYKYENGSLRVCHEDEDIDAITDSFSVTKSGNALKITGFDPNYASYIIGTWTVTEGADAHQLRINADNTLEFVDGSETFSAEYTFSDRCITISSSDTDISCFSFVLKGATLIRYEYGEADGYQYKKAE